MRWVFNLVNQYLVRLDQNRPAEDQRSIHALGSSHGRTLTLWAEKKKRNQRRTSLEKFVCRIRPDQTRGFRSSIINKI